LEIKVKLLMVIRLPPEIINFNILSVYSLQLNYYRGEAEIDEKRVDELKKRV